MMTLRTTIFAAAALVAGFVNIGCAGAAMAQGQETIEVSYADLNLANRAGRVVLEERVADAAATLCGAFDPRHLTRAEAGRACISATLAATQPQIEAALGRRGTVEVASLSVRVSRAAN